MCETNKKIPPMPRIGSNLAKWKPIAEILNKVFQLGYELGYKAAIENGFKNIQIKED